MFSKIVIGRSAECHVWVVADGGAHECRLALSAGREFDRAPNVYLLMAVYYYYYYYYY